MKDHKQIQNVAKTSDGPPTYARGRNDRIEDSTDRLRQEIHLRKLTEQALTGSEEKYRMVVDNAREGIFVVQHERFRFANPRALEILNRQDEDIIPKPFVRFIHPEDSDMVLHRYRRRIKGEAPPSRYPIRMLDYRGNAKWVEIHVTRITWEGQPAVMGFMTDISDRIRIEEALRDSEEKYQTIIQNIEDGYYESSVEGNLTFINDSFCKILGYPRDQLLGLNFRHYADEKNAERCYLTFNKVYKSGRATRVHDWEIIRKDGEKRIIEVSITLIVNSEGEKTGFRGIARDITDRRRAEEELRKHRNHLEEVIDERTRELRGANERLLTAQEKERKRVAQELHDGIGQSLTAIKFRLESALTRVDGASPEIHRTPLEGLVPVIQDAIEEVRRISMDLRPSILDDLGILATISWFCREFESTWSGIQVDRKIEIKETDVPDCRKIAVFRVLQEAFNNVAKHSGADRVFLYLGNRDRQSELIIRDNGKGFDTEAALSIDRCPKGFGLAGMRQRVKLSGGSFEIESGRSKGTTVRARWSSE